MSAVTEAVVFCIDGAFYALPVTMVREILDDRRAYRVPSAQVRRTARHRRDRHLAENARYTGQAAAG